MMKKYLMAPFCFCLLSASEYTVQYGDNLLKIARENGVSVQQLKTLNGLSSNVIQVGQTLTLEAETDYPVAVAETVAPPCHSGQYRMQYGDTLYSVARKFGVSVNDLLAWNNIADVRDISVGTNLLINGGSAPVVKTSEPQRTYSSRPVASGTRVVKKGDTIYGISKQHGIDQQQLMVANGITDPGSLYIGQVLKLQGGQTVPVQHRAAQTRSTEVYDETLGDYSGETSRPYQEEWDQDPRYGKEAKDDETARSRQFLLRKK